LRLLFSAVIHFSRFFFASVNTEAVSGCPKSSPIWERFFAVFVHLFSNVLLFHGARKREPRWFWLAFAFKSGIDAIAAFAQFWGLNTLLRLLTIELVVALWGIVGWLGTRAIRDRYPLLENDMDA
jgi:hypothetical protein